MFANFLIGLREGLEAGLVVGILLAYATKLGRVDVKARLWWGVGIAVVFTLAVGALLTWGPYQLEEAQQELLGGVLSMVAVGLVTWMIFWMRAHGSRLAGELRSQLSVAMAGAGTGIVVLGAVSVAREGVETALFVWANIAGGAGALAGTIGAVLGIACAVVLSYLIYRGLVRINLARFFSWTGGLLIVVAGGVLAYAVHDLIEAGVLPELDPVYSLSGMLPLSSPLGAVLGGIFNYRPEPTLLEVGAWVSYLTVVFAMFFWPRRATNPSAAVAAANDSSARTGQTPAELPSDSGASPTASGASPTAAR